MGAAGLRISPVIETSLVSAYRLPCHPAIQFINTNLVMEPGHPQRIDQPLALRAVYCAVVRPVQTMEFSHPGGDYYRRFPVAEHAGGDDLLAADADDDPGIGGNRPTQAARIKRGMGENACKKMHQAEFRAFAGVIDERIQTECLFAPPDPHPRNMFCQWRFYMGSG